MNMNKILVVGGTGKVGGVVVEELARAGEPVRAGTRNPAKTTLPAGVEPVALDLANPSTFSPALQGCNRVFLMEPPVPSDTPPEKFMLPFLEAAARDGRKVVLMTTLSVNFDETEPMRSVEAALQKTGTPFVILRPNWFMDNFHTLWIEPIKHAGVIPVPAADSRSAFIDTRDIGACGAAVLRTDRYNGRALGLSGPEALTYGEAATAISKAVGREIQYVPMDDEAFIKSLVDAGQPAGLAEYITWLFRWTRKGVAAADVLPTVQELTGRAPRTFSQYAQDHAAAWK